MLFKNAHIFEDGRFQYGSFRVEDGRFTEILTSVPAEDGIDLNGQYVIPGLVDIHNHGNSGADFSDGDYDGLVKMARYLAANGVTSFAPTSMTLPYDVLEAAYKTAVQLKKTQPEGCARLMGIHMEGPFFSEKKKGAQNGAYLRLPDFEAFQRLYDVSEGLIRIADVAAELPGAIEFAEKASRLCTVSIAHTDCTYEEASAVFDAGASHLTHLYNAIRHITERPRGSLVAANAGIAVLALVQIFVLHSKSFRGAAVNISSRNEPDDPAAVAADGRFLQIGVSSFLCRLLARLFCLLGFRFNGFRLAHRRLETDKLVRFEKQCAVLHDLQHKRSVQRFQAFHELCRVVPVQAHGLTAQRDHVHPVQE